ncbi:MAG: nuclear transport factor 2 family protein [Pyrinomonadaceae bacterium]
MLKRILIFTILTIFTASLAYGQKASGAKKADPTAPVKAAFESLMDGIREVDAAKVLAAYEKSDRILIFNNNGTATIGWENIKSNTESSYPKIKNVTLDITGLRVEMLSKTSAYVTCKWKQTQEYDGKPESASGRMTLIYRLIGKDWKIVHRHTSPDNPPETRPVFPSEREPK